MKRFGENARVALLLASVCASPFALCAPAAAQDTPIAEEEESITVTARRREESLQDVPLAVSVETAEELDQRGADNITVLQQTTPNATVQVARGSNSTLISFIRGVGQQDPLWGFEPGVGLYIDDVYIARPQAAVLDIFDINRIEVLRGPQGTLYGRNTIGGAIKYVTNRLDPNDPHLTARFNAGTYNQMEAILTGSMPLGNELVVGGAVAGYIRDGYGDNLTTGEEHYNKDVEAFRLSAEWSPTDHLFFRLSADHVNDDSNARHGHRELSYPAGGAAYDVLPSVYDTRAGLGDDNHVEATGYSLLGEWDISDALTLKSITAYRRGNTDTLIDFDGTPNATLDVPAYYADHQLSQEFQLLWEGERIQGVAGLYFLDASAEGAFDTIVGALATTIFTQGQVDTESVAAFADVSFDITDQLSASLGARWTRDEKEGTVFRRNFTGIRSPFFGNGAAVPGLIRSNYTNSRTFEEVTPRASLTFEPSDDLTLYASYSQGFKSGGFDMRGDVVLTPATVNGYDPEFVETYEIGFHSSWFDGRANISGAVFASEYTDMQITRQEPTLAGSIASFVDNAASATINGAELEGTLQLSEALTANFAVGYIDAEFDEYNSFTTNPAPPPAVIPIDLSGVAAFQNTPDLTGAFSLTYAVPVGAGVLAITPSASYRGDSQMFEFAAPALDQQSFWLYNASMTWTSDNDRWRLGLHGLNLGDEEYRVGGYNFPLATGPFFGNSVIGFYGPPRTVTASVEVRF
jgi:iron complex outermembrane receptor protein